LDNDKKSVYNTTYEILVGLSKMIAPYVPFIAEELYQNLTDGESVHLADYPVINEDLINNRLEEKMDLVRNLVTLGRAVREENDLKVRQPIQKVLVDGKHEELINELVPLMKDELNVKEIVFTADLSEYMDYNIKPNFQVVGPILRNNMKFFAPALAKLDANEIKEKVQNCEVFTVELNGENFEVKPDYVNIEIKDKEGFAVAMDNNLFVILDTTLSQELLDEGYAREFVSKIQQIRKSNGYEVMDNIEIYYYGDEDIFHAVEAFEDYIKKETLAVSIEKIDGDFETYDLNEHETGIKLEKVE